MPGRWFSTTAGRFLEYESLLERGWMLLLDFDRDVEWICEQPLRLRYRKDDKLAGHVPDLLVWSAGRPELCDVKSEERLEDHEFLAQVEATGLACAEAQAWGYWVLSEPDRQASPDAVDAGGRSEHDRRACLRCAGADACAVAGGGMTGQRWPLGIGGQLVIDGETITVHCVDGADVRGYTAGGERVRFALRRVAEEPARAATRRGGSALCCSTPAR
jgi:hypothetical protein